MERLSDRPGEIDVAEAVANFRVGRVLVSCGLVTEITANDKYGPGDLVPPADEFAVTVRVVGPGWVTADTVALYANGVKVQEARVTEIQRVLDQLHSGTNRLRGALVGAGPQTARENVGRG